MKPVPTDAAAAYRPWSALRAVVPFVLTLAVAALAGLAALGETTSGDRPAPDAPRSAFQRLLDENGIALDLPAQGKAIVVNIPGFELVAFEDAMPVFRSRVIVGAPWHRTPRIETYTSAVRFRPTWRPTPSMIASGEYRDRVWPAGPSNPLGLAAVRLEPGMLVYLHDTNHRELFAHEMRALSHGCIRVERWDRLVAWVLDLPLDEVMRLANGTRTFDYPAPPIPVMLVYHLRFPEETGVIVEHADIYGLGPRAELSLGARASGSDEVPCAETLPG